jgi:hypothetical protein
MSEPMLIERALPAYDAVRAEHRVLAATPTRAWSAVMNADFMRTADEIPAVRILFGVRTAAERAVAAVRGRTPAPATVPDSMRLAEMPSRGEWVVLGEEPLREIAFGAIGRFWAGETAWEEISAAEFGSFDRPGLAKIACSFSLRPYGAERTLVSYECRTRGTDASARRAFMRYWRPLSPFIGVVLRAQLSTIETTLEEGSRHE